MKPRSGDSAEYRRAKFALADRMRRDKRLTFAQRTIGAELLACSWEYKGCQKTEGWFAKVLGASGATVKSAIKRLKGTGYIRIEKRGRSNTYFPIFEQGQN